MSFTKEGISLPSIRTPKCAVSQIVQLDSDKARMDYILQSNRSALDLVLDEARLLKKQVSVRDAQKLDEYFSSVREVEQRCRNNASGLRCPHLRWTSNCPPMTLLRRISL